MIQVRAIGIPWYRREDYPGILRIMADSDKLPPTWTDGNKRAEQALKLHQGNGAVVEKVYLDPNEFTGWCALRGLNIDAQARIRFANEAVARKYRNADG